ncbi:hypothetical protein Taro_047889 [Colocasia esculenta]|uniref:Cystic fibrosis transmembrane conductance regulator n=1 Tax=Colocasia esculenta TaxID=4460 RepID=A0A843WWM8_COLES|nr:hypothetical protein [Colocasia esculenta]
MVGLFFRLYGGRSGHRRSQSAVDIREPSQQNAEATVSAGVASANSHGLEYSAEFKPVEHPTEPLDNDQPVKCPLPEPSILHDGRIWKERMSANARARTDLPAVMENSDTEPEIAGSRTHPASAKHVILPSYSAPEHNIVNLLEECNAS